MQRTVIYGDKLVNENDMNGLQTDIAANIIAYTPLNLTWSDNNMGVTDYSVYQGGVFGDPRNASLDRDLKVIQNGTGSLLLCAGKALVVSGSILTAPSGSALVINGASGSAYGNVVGVPNDVVLYCPGSSSVYSWLSNADGTYYVKISYAENLMTYASGAANSLGTLGSGGYTRVEDSYFVTVDTTKPKLNEIGLAEVPVSGGEVSTGSILDIRSYVTSTIPSWGVSLDPALNTIPEVKTAYDHVMARGTGIVTLKNPHGMGPDDIGALPSSSLSKYGNITSGVMNYNQVYQNGDVIVFFDANVETDHGRRMDLWDFLPMSTYNYSWSLYASSSGVLSSTGSLFGSVIELARLSYRYRLTDTGYDGIAFQDDLQAFIPPNWYYKVTATATPQFNVPTGSIRFTTTFL